MRLLEFERRKRRWSQAHLADLAGLPQSDISLLETGRLRPSDSQAARLVRLGLLAYLLYRPRVPRDFSEEPFIPEDDAE